MYPIDLRTLPAQPLAALPHKGPYPQIKHAFEKLFAALATRNLLAETGNMVGVFYDAPSATAPEALRSHAAVQVPASLALAAPVESVTLPSGRHAVLRYVSAPIRGCPPPMTSFTASGCLHRAKPLRTARHSRFI
jgi:AraC family transcriptional regulator